MKFFKKFSKIVITKELYMFSNKLYEYLYKIKMKFENEKDFKKF